VTVPIQRSLPTVQELWEAFSARSQAPLLSQAPTVRLPSAQLLPMATISGGSRESSLQPFVETPEGAVEPVVSPGGPRPVCVELESPEDDPQPIRSTAAARAASGSRRWAGIRTSRLT
jgi:hypothetical protein